MKNRILLLASMLTLMASLSEPIETKAQVYKHNTASAMTLTGDGTVYVTGTDTLNNATTKNDTIKVTEDRKAVTFLLVTKKISGTVGGTWVIRGGAKYNAKLATLTTINLTDAENTYSYTVPGGNPYIYYEFALTTTGTQQSSHQRQIVVR